LSAADRYPVTGIVLRVDPAHRTFVASCAAIPGYMEAMSRPYSVRDPRDLANLKPDADIDFTHVVEKDRSYAESTRPHRFEPTDLEPLRARRLQLLEPPHAAIHPGDPVPDFTHTDQTGRRISLSEFSGKVVAVTFIYTTCPALPDYCFRLSSNFGQIRRRFGSDLVLLSITFDSVHDTPQLLARYAATWKADPRPGISSPAAWMKSRRSAEISA